ncbi:MAG: hypothetical protein LWW94_01945 [Candidatus Desulfofervidaceae bacterium]|nr:hypothetical protein [Candidatus Desulfofervidaceae bacterium]
MKAEQLIKELKAQGIKIKLVGRDKIWLGPEEKLTPELINVVRKLKDELIALLKKTEKQRIYKGYTYDQLCQMFIDLLKAHGGYILVKCSYLDNEVVAWALPGYVNKLSRKSHVVYLPSELATLLIKQPSPESLKKAHEIKKTFAGKIVLQ